jgi:hypothetical protein
MAHEVRKCLSKFYNYAVARELVTARPPVDRQSCFHQSQRPRQRRRRSMSVSLASGAASEVAGVLSTTVVVVVCSGFGATVSPELAARGAWSAAGTTSSWPLGDDRGQRAKARKQAAERAGGPRRGDPGRPCHRPPRCWWVLCMDTDFSWRLLMGSCLPHFHSRPLERPRSFR